MLYLTLVFYTCIYRFYILHLCTLVQHWYKCYLYLCVVFENGALKINTCACVVLVLCGAKFDSDLNHIKSVHIEYLNAGCDVITVNSYAIVQQRLEGILGYGREDSEAAWNKMMENALKAANDARHEWVGHETNSEAQRTILIAGSSPPLHGSYKPNEVGKYSRILETYKNRNGKNLRFSNSAKK